MNTGSRSLMYSLLRKSSIQSWLNKSSNGCRCLGFMKYGDKYEMCIRPSETVELNRVNNLNRSYSSVYATNKKCKIATFLTFKEAIMIESNLYKPKQKQSARTFSEKQQISTKLDTPVSSKESPVISKADQLKRAVKDYGSTVIVFHVAISLTSLGLFYLLVSR